MSDGVHVLAVRWDGPQGVVEVQNFEILMCCHVLPLEHRRRLQLARHAIPSCAVKEP